MLRSDKAALRDLGWRLRHHLAARNFDADRIAQRVGVLPDDFALALVGEYDLPFSVLCAVLDQLDLEWWDLYGADVRHSPTTHNLTVPSDTWNAIDGGLQAFDVRRDVDRYRVGDILHLHESLEGKATGRVIVAEVTHILYVASVGLTPGELVLAIRSFSITEARHRHSRYLTQSAGLQLLCNESMHTLEGDRLWEKIQQHKADKETIIVCERVDDNERQYLSNHNDVEFYYINFDTKDVPPEDLKTFRDPVSGITRPVIVGYFSAQRNETFVRTVRDLGNSE